MHLSSCQLSPRQSAKGATRHHSCSCPAADGAFELVGNRTECGLLQMAAALGADYEAIRRKGSVLRMFPFSSERKRMTSVVAQPGSRSALAPLPP